MMRYLGRGNYNRFVARYQKAMEDLGLAGLE